MSCNCNFVKATSVAVTSELTEDYLTITVPADTTFTDGCWCIGLLTTIPTTVSCARIVVTNGTDNVEVLKCNGDYWRPCLLKCRSVLKLRHLSDPEHFLFTGFCNRR